MMITLQIAEFGKHIQKYSCQMIPKTWKWAGKGIERMIGDGAIIRMIGDGAIIRMIRDGAIIQFELNSRHYFSHPLYVKACLKWC